MAAPYTLIFSDHHGEKHSLHLSDEPNYFEGATQIRSKKEVTWKHERISLSN